MGKNEKDRGKGEREKDVRGKKERIDEGRRGRKDQSITAKDRRKKANKDTGENT